MIIDRKQYENFLNILPDLQDDEVYFISLSARNKYLTAEEREDYTLGRTEMFARTIIREKKDFDYAMEKLKSTLIYKHTKNGKNIPEKALVTYVNVNPSSMIKAYELFIGEMNKELFQVYQSEKNSKQTNYQGFIRLDRKLMNSIQKSKSRRYFIDIDFDVNDIQVVNDFCKQLKDTIHYIISTHGGWHILIKKDTISEGVRLDELVKYAHNSVKQSNGEVIFNKNQMVPVPGTEQAGTLVKLIN